MGARARDKGLLAVLPLTSGVQALLVVFAALTPEEQEEAFVELRTLRVEAQDEAEREMDTYLRSLRRVAEVIGHTPGVPEYKEVSVALREQGEDIEPFTRLYRYFGTSWARARRHLNCLARRGPRPSKRASRIGVSASPGATPRTNCGKRWRPASRTSAGLPTRRTIPGGASGSSNLRERSAGTVCTSRRRTYRERWGGWEPALLHFGYTPDTRAHQLARRESVLFAEDEPHLPDGLSVAKLAPVARAQCR